MTAAPPSSAHTSNLLSTHRALLDTLTSFLTVAIHHILYLRKIYPPISFLAVRAYNYPVRQSRHPLVCTWINDAVAAVRDQMEKNTVENVAICIFETDNNQVLERWTIDLRHFPTVEKRDRDVPFENEVSSNNDQDNPSLKRKINLVDLEAQFRGMLAQATVATAKLKSLPQGGPDAPECSFTVTMEVKDDADRPVGRLGNEERKWIAAEPDVFEDEEDPFDDQQEIADGSSRRKPARGKTVPIRRLEAGELRMEMWIEESQAKLDLASKLGLSQDGSQQTQSSEERRAYDLEPPDVNRKPQGGAFTDYKR